MSSSSSSPEAVAEAHFDRYAYPAWLRTHSRLAGSVARAFAEQGLRRGLTLDADGVVLAALLHDIGRSPLLRGPAGEHHQRSAAILAAEGRPGLVELVRRHPVHAPDRKSVV